MGSLRICPGENLGGKKPFFNQKWWGKKTAGREEGGTPFF